MEEHREEQFGIAHVAWMLATVVTVREAKLYFRFGPRESLIFLRAHVCENERTTRLPEVWDYYPDEDV